CRGDARMSPLRVLRSLARLLQPVLAPLLLTRVTREQPRLLERRPHLLVESYERTRDPEPERAGLAAHTPAIDAGVDVVHVGRLRDPQRFGGQLAVRRDGEVALDRAAVDHDLSRARAQPDARDGFLAPSRGLDERLGQRNSSPS